MPFSKQGGGFMGDRVEEGSGFQNLFVCLKLGLRLPLALTGLKMALPPKGLTDWCSGVPTRPRHHHCGKENKKSSLSSQKKQSRRSPRLTLAMML